MSDEPQLPRDPDLLLAATLFLITQYALQPRPPIARAVIDHFDRLMECRELPPRVMLALPRLRAQWSRCFTSDAPVRRAQPTAVVIPFRAAQRRQ